VSYLFLTAAIGEQNLLDASKRLVRDAEALKIFSRFEIVTQKDLSTLMPEIISIVPENQWNSTHKYGYYIWKPQIANLALTGTWGDYDAVVFLDAGCEILPSYWNRKKLLSYLKKAAQNGAVIFHSKGPEFLYTKKSIFAQYPKVDSSDATPQIQSGSWILSGQKGISIASEWASKSSLNYQNISNEFDPAVEVPGFIAPRHDQSYFSLTCKAAGITPENVLPPGGGNGVRTHFRSLYFPFRWARNRSGNETNKYFYKVLGGVSLRVHALLMNFLNLK
jgi:hypothetical protein